MSKRVYNILFHSHTISGIIISALLYVIFFTGSITFLRDEINAWERNEPIRTGYMAAVNFDTILWNLHQANELYGRDVSMSRYYDERRINVSLTASRDTTLDAEENQRSFAYMDVATGQKTDYRSNYSLGEFFYRLHFFAQLNFFGRSGYLLSGLVAFFFLFAIITGVVVHWKKIVPNFFVFRPRAKWKTIWTDAHVGLGILGLPYQFMFAVTGAYLIIGYTVMLDPVQKYLFDGDRDKMAATMDYTTTPEFEFSGRPVPSFIPVQAYVDQMMDTYEDIDLQSVEIFNYGDENMHVKVAGHPFYDRKLIGSGHMTFHALSGELVDHKDPYGGTSYIEGAILTMDRLHFGDFGGYGMKLIYLVLGLISCFVIISGVMIWLVARDKKFVDPLKRKFNAWLVHVYLAVCLSLYPVSAFTFIAVKWLGDGVTDNRRAFIYDWFFWPWLLLSVGLLIKRDNRFTTRWCLILGCALGLLVPVVNGWVSGNWMWVSIQKGFGQIFVVDMFWLMLSVTSFFVLMKMKKPPSRPSHEPVQQKFPKKENQLSFH